VVSREWIRAKFMSGKGKARPVFIAALTREIAGLVSGRGWRADKKLLGRNIHLFEHEDAVVACAGMGTHRATLALEAALELGPASELVSVGWAGSCNRSVRVGQVFHATIVIDTRTMERYFTADLERDLAEGKSIDHQILVTVPVPAGAREKENLGISHYAAAVDMEAAAIARMARAKELPFHAIKAISDDVDFELPDMKRFTTSDGQLREAAFGLYLAWHPGLWKSVLTTAKSSKLAAQELRRSLEAHIEQTKSRLGL
jgi:adenosylhomocysteine nucleosidase